MFGIDRTVQNKLGEAEYGIYFAVFNFTYLFQILLDFGLQNYNARHVAANKEKLHELLPNILLFKTLLFFIYIIVCVVFAFPLHYHNYTFLYIIMINHFLLSFIIYLRSNIAAHQYFITDSLLSVLDKLLMIIFYGYLIWGNSTIKISILNFVLAQSLALLIAFLVCLYFTFKLSDAIKISFSFRSLKSIIKSSVPYAITYFLMTTYYRIDGVMLEQMKGSVETGIYAQGYRIIESINNIGYLLGLILLPLFSHYIAERKNLKILFFSSLKIMLVIIVMVVGVFYFQAVDIINLLYHHNQAYAAKVFSWLILNFIPIGLLYVIGTLHTAKENFRMMLPTLFFAVILNIILNYFLIHTNGAEGAAIATLITQLFVLLVYSVGIYKQLKIKIKLKYSMPILFFILSSILVMLVCNYIFNEHSLIDIVCRTSVFSCFVLVLSILLGLIDKEIGKLKTGLT